MLTQKQVQAQCCHQYYDYAKQKLGDGKEKVWRRCALCSLERTYVRKETKP